MFVCILVVTVIILSGCGEGDPQEEQNGEDTANAGEDNLITEPGEGEENLAGEGDGHMYETYDQLPDMVQEWIEASLTVFGAQTLLYEDVLYLLVTYGEKPTGGYDVTIEDISVESNSLIVTANFTAPGEDDMVTQAFTYPFDLAMLDNPDMPVEFRATGAEDSVPLKQ